MKIMDILSPIFNKRSTQELKHITDALDKTLETLSEDLNLLELEYVIKTASGEWLDEWGSWFGVTRESNESDEEYSARIIAIITKPKTTIPAIESSINAYVNKDYSYVTIYEPYHNVAKYNDAKYSGGSYYQDAIYWRTGVIEIVMSEEITQDIIDLVEQIKASGIKVYFTKYTVFPGEDGGVVDGNTDNRLDIVDALHIFIRILDKFINYTPSVIQGVTLDMQDEEYIVKHENSQNIMVKEISEEYNTLSPFTQEAVFISRITDDFLQHPDWLLKDIAQVPLEKYRVGYTSDFQVTVSS